MLCINPNNAGFFIFTASNYSGHSRLLSDHYSRFVKHTRGAIEVASSCNLGFSGQISCWNCFGTLGNLSHFDSV